MSVHIYIYIRYLSQDIQSDVSTHLIQKPDKVEHMYSLPFVSYCLMMAA